MRPSAATDLQAAAARLPAFARLIAGREPEAEPRLCAPDSRDGAQHQYAGRALPVGQGVAADEP